MSTKRCIWQKQEVTDLLAIMKEKQIMENLDGKTHRNRRVYVYLSDEMSCRGHNKSYDQIKSKFRALKGEYLSAKKNNNASGTGKMEIEHFHQLEELLGPRPVVSADGMDTIENDIMDSEVSFLEANHSEEVESESSLELPASSGGVKRKRNALQSTLIEIAADVKNSHQSALKMIKEENENFLREQRQLQVKYLQDTKKILEDDRKQMRDILEKLLKN